MVYSNIDSRTSSRQAFIYRKVSAQTQTGRARETDYLSPKKTPPSTRDTKKNEQIKDS